ncbi:hypothetical protein ACFLXC_03195 [Chloroflexota bacterium]
MARSAGQLTPEAIVDSLDYPASANGEVNPAFVAGMKYEAKNIIRGIRIAQELNKMGLEQAKPVIEMAKEMRQAEGQAAQVLAAQFGQMTMQNNQQILSAIHEMMSERERTQVETPPSDMNPIAKMILPALQPYIGQLVGKALTGLTGQQPGGQSQPGQQPLISQPQNQAVNDKTPPACMKEGEENEFSEI